MADPTSANIGARLSSIGHGANYRSFPGMEGGGGAKGPLGLEIGAGGLQVSGQHVDMLIEGSTLFACFPGAKLFGGAMRVWGNALGDLSNLSIIFKSMDITNLGLFSSMKTPTSMLATTFSRGQPGG